MSDKENKTEIDVTACEFYKKFKQFTIDDNYYKCNEKDYCECHLRKCQDNPDCYYKQLQREKQRADELTASIENRIANFPNIILEQLRNMPRPALELMYAIIHKDNIEFQHNLSQAKEKLEKAKKCLEFYATRKNIEKYTDYTLLENGKNAQQLLEELNK